MNDFFALDSLELLRTYGGPAYSLWGPWGHGLGTELPADSRERSALRKAGGLFTPIEQWTRQHLSHRTTPPTAPAKALAPHRLLDPASGIWRPTDVDALTDLAHRTHELESTEPCHSPR